MRPIGLVEFNDYLTFDGGEGNDSIVGGDDADVITAGAGADVVDGGAVFWM